jgi:dihydroxy-acid dehydratase
MIEIDARAGTVTLKLAESELSERRQRWQAPKIASAGLLEKYALCVRSASVGAVTHSGAVCWPQDIVDGD